MNWSLPSLSIRHPIALIMFVASMATIGVICFHRVPEDERIKFDYRDVYCRIPYTGAAPETVEREVTIVAEGELLTMPHIKAIHSVSAEGGSSITVRFDGQADMANAVAELRGRVERIKLRLPKEANRVLIGRHRTSEWACFRIAMFRKENEEELARLVRSQVQTRLTRVPGVAAVSVSGIQNEEVYVDFDQEALKRYSLSLHSIIPILQSSNINVSVGQVLDSQVRCFVRALNEVTTPAQLENLVIGPNSLRLKDIALVRRALPPEVGTFTFDGKRGVFIEVRKEAEASLIDTCHAVRAEIDRICKEAPFKGVETYVFEDRSQRVELAMNSLANAAKVGGVLSLFIVFLFVWRVGATALLALNIPISLIVVFIYLYARDMTFNMVTMAGMITVIGRLVDDAIVVMENIYRRNQLYPHMPVENAVDGAREVGVAVAASTFTSVIVFLPVFYLEEGELSTHMREFAVPVSIALLASLFLSMTLIPLGMLVLGKGRGIGHWFRGLRAPGSRKDATARRRWAPNRAMLDGYSRVLTLVLRQRMATVFILFAFLGLTVAIPYRNVGLRLQKPSADNRVATISVSFDQNVDLDMAAAVFKQLSDTVESRREELQIKNVYVDYRASGGSIRAYLKQPNDLQPGEHIRFTTEEVRDVFSHILPEKVPGGQLRFGTTQQASRDTQTLSLLMQGDDSAVLSGLADRFRELLSAQPDVCEVHINREREEQELQLQVDPSLALQSGITPLTVSRTVDFALRGVQLPYMKGERCEMPVHGRFPEDDRTKDNLDNMLVTGAGGRLATLNTILSAARSTTPQVLERHNGKSVIGVTVEVLSADLKRTSADIARLIDSFAVPRGYTIDKGYEISEMDSILRNFFTTLTLSIVLIYIIMAMLFESLMLPMSIMTTIPLSLVGIYWTMYLTGTTMDTISLIGIIVMCGIIVNNAIVIVDRIAQLQRGGMPRFEAIIQAGRDRFRPVVMTALTTIAGALPIAVGSPQKKDLLTDVLDSLGRTIVGGMGVGTLLTLLVVPLFYTLIDDIQTWGIQYVLGIMRIRRRRSVSQPVGEP